MKMLARWTVAGIIFFPLLGGWSISGPGGASEDPRPDARRVLDRLKALEGTWRGEGGTVGGETNAAVHEFRVLAGGTVVVEIMDPDGEREMNVYHLDGEDLLMTHYCGGGYQSTMKLSRSGGDSGPFDFVFVRATNLPNLDRRHVHASRLILRGTDRIESWWTFYKEGREAAASKFVLTRAGPDPGARP